MVHNSERSRASFCPHPALLIVHKLPLGSPGQGLFGKAPCLPVGLLVIIKPCFKPGDQDWPPAVQHTSGDWGSGNRPTTHLPSRNPQPPLPLCLCAHTVCLREGRRAATPRSVCTAGSVAVPASTSLTASSQAGTARSVGPEGCPSHGRHSHCHS